MATISEYQKDIFEVTIHSEGLSDQSFAEFLIQLEELYQTRKNIILVVDATKALHLPTPYRQRMGNWMAQNKSLIRDSCVFQIYVVHSPLVRFVLQGIFLIQKPPVSFKTMSHKGDARKLAVEIMESLQGVPLDHHM